MRYQIHGVFRSTDENAQICQTIVMACILVEQRQAYQSNVQFFLKAALPTTAMSNKA